MKKSLMIAAAALALSAGAASAQTKSVGFEIPQAKEQSAGQASCFYRYQYYTVYVGYGMYRTYYRYWYVCY